MKITVIIPTHGGTLHIVNAVQSTIKQTYPNIEIIVVDDNGKGTLNQIKTQELLYDLILSNKIKYIVHEFNLNGSAARNTGVKFSSGEYIAFLDDDDEFLPDKLELQANTLNNSKENIAGSYSSKVVMYGKKVKETRYAIHSGDLLLSHHMHKVSIGTPSLLLKKAYFNIVGGFDESFRRHQDWEFVGKILNKFELIPCKDAFYIRNLTFRHNPENLNQSRILLSNYIDNLSKISPRLTKFQRQIVINYNWSLLGMKYIKENRFFDFVIISKGKNLLFLSYFIIINIIKYPFLKTKR
jgi:glycosyltransferase involved in cell wall biosynthesis